MNKAIIIILSALLAFYSLSYTTTNVTVPKYSEMKWIHQFMTEKMWSMFLLYKEIDDKLYYEEKISVSLLHALQKARPNENLFFSPHSIYQALLLAYFGAKGETEKSLKKILQLDWAKSKADVSHVYELKEILQANRREYQTIEFNSVNK